MDTGNRKKITWRGQMEKMGAEDQHKSSTMACWNPQKQTDMGGFSKIPMLPLLHCWMPLLLCTDTFTAHDCTKNTYIIGESCNYTHFQSWNILEKVDSSWMVKSIKVFKLVFVSSPSYRQPFPFFYKFGMTRECYCL